MVTKRMVLERDRALKLENTNKISIGMYGTCVGVPFSQLIVESLWQCSTGEAFSVRPNYDISFWTQIKNLFFSIFKISGIIP
jgi:hypothetical protein